MDDVKKTNLSLTFSFFVKVNIELIPLCNEIKLFPRPGQAYLLAKYFNCQMYNTLTLIRHPNY